MKLLLPFAPVLVDALLDATSKLTPNLHSIWRDPDCPPIAVSNQEQARQMHTVHFINMVERGELVPRSPLLLSPCVDFKAKDAARTQVSFEEAAAFCRVLGIRLEPLIEGASDPADDESEPAPPVIERHVLKLKTGELAKALDGLPYTADQWLDKLRNHPTMWLRRHRVTPPIKGNGGAPSEWDAVGIARSVVGRTKDKENSAKLMRGLNARFNSDELLAPGRNEWSDFFSQMSD